MKNKEEIEAIHCVNNQVSSEGHKMLKRKKKKKKKRRKRSKEKER